MSREVVENLKITPGNFYVDGTFGSGGHSAKILQAHTNITLLGCDISPISNEKSQTLIDKFPNFSFTNMNFKDLRGFLSHNELPSLNGLVLDLGCSTDQIKDLGAGLSYSSNNNLDMRLDPNLKITARYILNKYPSKKLWDIFTFGDIKKPYPLIQNIIKNRKIVNSQDLLKIIDETYPVRIQPWEKKIVRLVFQALRLEVNGDIPNLKSLLNDLSFIMSKGGRVVILSFQSLEENAILEWIQLNCFPISNPSYKVDIPNQFEWIGKTFYIPSNEELKENAASRSARMWIIEKK